MGEGEWKERRVSSIEREDGVPRAPFVRFHPSRRRRQSNARPVRYLIRSRLSSTRFDNAHPRHLTLRGSEEKKGRRRRRKKKKEGKGDEPWQEKGSRLLIYVVVPVKRRWTSINPWKRGWERGDGERILRPESTARMNARKNRVLIILRFHHPSCASWTICKSDVDVRLRFIELEEYFYIKIFAFDSSSKMEDPDVYYFQGWTRNFVKILHRLADYLRCLWYRVLPKLEGAWIFSFSPFFFFSVTDSRANSRVTQWSRRWRTCVIGRNSFHAIYMPRKLRVCAAYICISLDPLFRWQRLSSRRWAVVPISDDSELATTLSRSNIGHRCKTLRLATCLRAVQDHSTHYPRGRRHVPLRDHVFVEFKIFPYIVKNYKSKYPWINFVEKCSVRWRGKIFYFIISIQLSRPFIPSILISLLTS